MKKLLQLLRDNAAKERQPLNLVRNEEKGEATLYIYDVIDPWWGVSALDVAKSIAGLDPKSTLHLRVNSPGGDVFEGRAIRTHIAQFAGKTVGHIDGLAASAATTIVDGCDEVEISEGGFYMVHNGWTLSLGNKHEMRRTADLLDKVDAAIVGDYAKRTGVDAKQLVAWMDDETWFSAQEAIDHGFVSRLATLPDKTQNTAKGKPWDLAAFDKTPKALLNAPAPTDATPDYAAIHAHNARRLRLLSTA